ncbi:hypothetical protein EON66_00990 [archaeon]|nr:MAG: hypothetical protein EON66_00990 [archaeon]
MRPNCSGFLPLPSVSPSRTPTRLPSRTPTCSPTASPSQSITRVELVRASPSATPRPDVEGVGPDALSAGGEEAAVLSPPTPLPPAAAAVTAVASVSLTFLFALFALIPLGALLLACCVLKRADDSATQLVHAAVTLNECWAATNRDATGLVAGSYAGASSGRNSASNASDIDGIVRSCHNAGVPTPAAATISAASQTVRLLFTADSAFTRSLSLQLCSGEQASPTTLNPLQVPHLSTEKGAFSLPYTSATVPPVTKGTGTLSPNTTGAAATASAAHSHRTAPTFVHSGIPAGMASPVNFTAVPDAVAASSSPSTEVHVHAQPLAPSVAPRYAQTIVHAQSSAPPPQPDRDVTLQPLPQRNKSQAPARSVTALMKQHVASVLGAAALEGMQRAAATTDGAPLPPDAAASANWAQYTAEGVVSSAAVALHLHATHTLPPAQATETSATDGDAHTSSASPAITASPMHHQVSHHVLQHEWLLRSLSLEQLHSSVSLVGGLATVERLIDCILDACAREVHTDAESRTQRRAHDRNAAAGTEDGLGDSRHIGRTSFVRRGFNLSSIRRHAPAPSNPASQTTSIEQPDRHGHGSGGSHGTSADARTLSSDGRAHADAVFLSRIVAACAEAAYSELSGFAQAQAQHAGSRGSDGVLSASSLNATTSTTTRGAVQLLVTGVLQTVITTAADHARLVAEQLAPQVRELHSLGTRARAEMAMRRAKRYIVQQRFLARWASWICCCVRDGTSMRTSTGKQRTPGTTIALHASGTLAAVGLQYATAESTVKVLSQVPATRCAGGDTALREGAHATAATRVTPAFVSPQERGIAAVSASTSSVVPAVDREQRKVRVRRLFLSDDMSELLDLASEVQHEAAAPFMESTDIAFGLHSAASCVDAKRSSAQNRDAVFDGQHPVYANPLLSHGRAGASSALGAGSVASSANRLQPGSSALSSVRGSDGRKPAATAAVTAERKTDARQMVSMGPVSVRHVGH